MTEKQKYLLKLFKEVDEICKENNLRYVMSGGSLIGAVRHEGFVPWDDDVDLYMPRSDWEKFVEICKTQLPPNRAIQCSEVDRNYTTFNTTAAISQQQSGLGMKIGDVVHARDVFLDKSYRNASGRQAYYAATYEAVDEVYTFYQELQGQAFQNTLEDFWTAFQEWARTPDDSVQQNLVIQKANLFVSRSNAVYTGLSDYQSTINTQISDDIDRINELGNTIFKLNLEIQKVESGNVETAMTLRDERDNALDELASYVDISYKENSDGIVKVSVEGVEFVDEARCYEMGKNRDEITGFVTPYWTHLSDIENGDYDNVFSFTTPISSDLNNDLGELKALILARGDRKATYKDIVGLTSDEYNRSTADSIATGMSVMLQAQAQLDQLVHGMITAINDTLCPNTTLGELTGNTASLTGTDENGNTVTITSGMKVLDTKNCSTGSDKQIPPQELFTRLGTERYTKVSVQETDANGNTVTNDYYVYNEESETDTSKQYTLASVSVNDKLVEQESLLPHLSQNGKVNYDLAQKVAALWKGEYLTLDPDDTNKVTFIDYYNNMVGAFGTIGSVYESTAKSLSGTVTAVDNQRSQVMGVSSDEELTKMIKFQNAYNASSRFINVVNEMIESMITQLGS